MATLGKSPDALCVKSFWRLNQVYRTTGEWWRAAGALLPFFLSNGVPGYSKEEKAKALSYAAVAPQAAKKSLHRTLAALPRTSARRAVDALESN
eukprot:s2555_g11.t1